MQGWTIAGPHRVCSALPDGELMGFLDRLLGREPTQVQRGYAGKSPSGAYAGSPSYPPQSPSAASQGSSQASSDVGGSEDERAVARYRYLLRTAPPDALEQVHAEAFARLTPEQRQQVLTELSRGLPAGERSPSNDPQSMARAATRAELRQPGYLEQTFQRGRFAGAGMGGGMGMGGMVMGSMMGTMAGVVIGSAIADSLFDGYDSSPEAADASDSGGDAGSDASGDTSGGDTGTDTAGDTGSDVGLSDSGYDAGGFDSGFGGGDFGGGDFGGGGDMGSF
jgi:hypothetical protein